MNADDVTKYGHLTFLGTLEGVTEEDAALPGACGVWSIRQIVSHIASYELVLVDVLAGLGGDAPTPMLDRFCTLGPEFNDAEVAARDGQTLADAVGEYTKAEETATALLCELSDEKIRRPGTLPWYGIEYSLDDLIVYQYYGHKREHGAQIMAFRDRLAAGEPILASTRSS